MPRPLSIALIATLCWAFTARADGPEPTTVPAVKKALDKAEADCRRNRKAYDEANTKAVAEAEKTLKVEVDRLSKAGKLEEAVAVKKLLENLRDRVVAKAEESGSAGNPSQSGAMAWKGHKYKYFAEGMTWHEAKRKCEELGGHLVIVDGNDEQAFVIRSLSGLGDAKLSVWLGITCEGTPGRWRTVEGEEVSYFRWQPGEPSHSNAVEPCAGINMMGGGSWNDCRSDLRLPFICEWDN